MAGAMFYHLTERPLEAVLPVLVERSLAQGWRVAIRGRDRAMLSRLDQSLWEGAPDSFLPHGLSGGPHDAAQPVLLTDGADLANGATCLMAVDGAEVTTDEAAELDRVCILFDGHDEGAVEGARNQWRRISAAGIKAQYWAESDGRWSMKAES